MNGSSPPKWVPPIVAILATIGIPIAAIAALNHFVTAHPLFSLAVTVIYEVAVVILGSLGKIWQRLESQWVERIATWIDTRVQWVLSGSHRRYCQHLFYQHRDFDVKGLSTQGIYTLLLDQVFVELSILPKEPHQTSSNPIRVPQELGEGTHSIWDYLSSRTLAHEHLVIIGAPGSGKTTLLKHITLTLAARKKRNLRRLKVPNELPIFLFLRDQNDAVKDKPDYSLTDAIRDHLRKWNLNMPTGWIEQWLAKGRCLILLDGLDEIADLQMRQKIVNWVQHQMITYGKNRFIITSRPFGYQSNPLSGVAVLEVHPFAPKQVELFIHNWYIANELMSSQRNDPGVQMTAKHGAEDLLQRLRNTPALLALAVNPLLLTMIATVHRYRSSLPGKRVELYAEIFEVFLGKRQQARGLILDLTAAQQQRVLQPLAYHLMDKGIREIALTEAEQMIEGPLVRIHPQLSPEAFLRLVVHGSGLLLERENDVYSFAHLTFQEYLAAVHIRENKWESILIAHIEESWWHETIRLYCAQADATAIIAACLAGNLPSVPALILALECQTEALEVLPTMRTQLNTLLNRDVESSDSERQLTVAEALLAQRLRQMIHLTKEIYIDTSLITCAEYQLFLNDLQARGMYYQPDHWENLHFPQGQGRSPVFGVRRPYAVAFCAWLTERDPGVWIYRLPKKGELEEVGDERIARKLKRDSNYWVEGEIESLKVNDDLILPETIELKQRRFSLIFDLAVSHIFTFASTFSSDLAGAHTLNLALDCALTIALDRAHIHKLSSDRDLASAIARTIASAVGSTAASTVALDRNRTLTLTLALALMDARDLALADSLDFAITLDRALDRALDLNLARTLTLDLDRALNSTFADSLAITLDLNPNKARVLAHDLVRTSAKILERSFSFSLLQEKNFEGGKLVEKLCQCICLLTEVAIIKLVYLSKEEVIPYAWRESGGLRRIFRRRPNRKQEEVDIIQGILTMYLDMYTTFALLEKRILQGTFPACEGILIVKERRKGNG